MEEIDYSNDYIMALEVINTKNAIIDALELKIKQLEKQLKAAEYNCTQLRLKNSKS